jgi:RimJ/RimL family protein N-acetyltransferase
MGSQRLVSERLILRRWSKDDVEPYAAMCADPEVMRWIGTGRVLTKKECADEVSWFESSWDSDGFGLFALERRDTGEFIGYTGLAVPNFLPEILPAVEIGWRLARNAWGQGYATEAARASLDFGLRVLRLDRVVSIHQIGNHASGRIMQKIGMTFARETVVKTCNRPVRVYEIIRYD